MSLVAEYKVGCRHLPLVDVAAAVPDAALRVDVGQPNQGGPPPFAVRAAAEFEAVERAFDESAFVSEYSVVGRTGDIRRYAVTPAFTMTEQFGDAVDDLARLKTLAANESVVDYIRVVADGWVQKRRFADRDAFDEYCAFWRENASFSLHRLATDDADATPAATTGPDLTDRQREALRTAHEMGYFEVPRGASLSEVAEELGISPPSLSERLRRGSAALVEDAIPVGHLKALTR
ncbi:DNA-binding protein [Halostella sp. JP-L12]|uniref:helix-turn-helix domain-containing protein n=1 Tax=Halostella TaxID=1843185 RepID=UPI000EF83F42|nr:MULTISPECIES: helix-turn-helix domain-containing protein [Halostella]NHN46636.1 DNA-binding protein [Halostella sp. JP-L12]